ncbi:hypothetical protein DIPPA_31055 [Diplonema papillatum]|nr:hypothetical protein DIPPA_31055 [Diplonema papillatum]
MRLTQALRHAGHTARRSQQARSLSVKSSSRQKRCSTRVRTQQQQQQACEAHHEKHEIPVFDTWSVVHELNKSGFTDRQAQAVMHLLDDILRSVVKRMRTECVPRETYSNDLQRQWSELDQMRRNIVVMEKTELYSLRGEINKAKADLDTLAQTRNMDVAKLENGVKLDQSLLKGFINQELAKTTEQFQHRVESELTKVEASFSKELESRISKAKLDAYRNVVGLLLAVATFIITYLRFFPPGSTAPIMPPSPPPQQHPHSPPKKKVPRELMVSGVMVPTQVDHEPSHAPHPDKRGAESVEALSEKAVAQALSAAGPPAAAAQAPQQQQQQSQQQQQRAAGGAAAPAAPAPRPGGAAPADDRPLPPVLRTPVETALQKPPF